MGDLEVCRICLVMDVKMYHLHLDRLNHYYESVMGLNLQNTTDLPLYVCFECAVLLKKCSNFRDRSVFGQSVLYTVLTGHGKITAEAIQQIDRCQLNLDSHLKPHNVPEESTIFFTHEEHAVEVIEVGDIKHEPSDDLITQIECIKQEDFLDNILGVSSDDDEPLSLHKSNKERQKTEKKKGKRGRKKKEKEVEVKDVEVKDEDDLGMEDAESLSLEAEVPPLPDQVLLQPVKRKRGRPRKTDAPVKPKEKVKKPRRTKNTGGVAFDDVAIEEYCTVVKLTVEQQIEEIAKRRHSANYVNAPFQCELCFKGFIDTHAWKHHVGKHDPSAGDVECAVCKFRFPCKRALQKHSAHHEKQYRCRACPYVSKTTTQAKQHQRWHKGITYKCQYCDEVSDKWTSYLSHVRMKHPSDFICGVCGYSFVSRLGLTMHKTMMHKDVAEATDAEGASKQLAGPYCADCDVQFVSLEAYKRHRVTSVRHTHANNFNKGCRVCGETFNSAEELRLHHRKEHARQRPKNYGKKPSNMTWPTNCEHCAEEIANAREYWTHFRRRHPDKPYPIQKDYVCDICGKSFRGNAFLVYHKRTHSEERAYKCAQCPKAFFNRTNLQMHEKTHSDVRPYRCDVCYKGFKCKGGLDRHYRSHTGVRPYECEVCGKAFAQSNSRKLHVRTVHLKLPAPYISRSRQERRKHHVSF